MSADLRARTIGFCSCIIILMACSSAGFADSVVFRRGDDSPPVAVSPASPTVFDVVHFTTPLDGNVHGNSCAAAAALGGYPKLSRDDADFTIDLAYDGNVPSICPLIYAPVVGAEGSLGPLAAGVWTLRDPHSNSVQFTVVPEPSSIMLLVVGGLVFSRRSRTDWQSVRARPQSVLGRPSRRREYRRFC